MAKKTWKKEDLIPSIGSKEYKKLTEELEKNVRTFESYKSRLKPSISLSDFMKMIKMIERLADVKSRIGSYAYLWFSEDTSDQKAKSFRSQTEQMLTNLGNKTMFFSLWFKGLDDKNAKRIINGVPNEYSYMLKYMRILKPHTLSEPEEKVINIKDTTGTNALIKIYDTITNAFVYTLKYNGKKLKLTRDQLSEFVRHEKSEIRKAAYHELYSIYSEEADVLNEIYRGVVLDWKNENVDLRKYREPISARNAANDVSAKAIETLLDVCRKNRFVFQEYFRLKARLCKIKKMTRYDIYARYGESNKKFSYEKSKKIVFDAYNKYSEMMASFAKKITGSDHVDYEIRRHKMGGAYCMNITPQTVPYVLLNHTGNLRSVFTMAHEFGHGVHDMLAGSHSILTFSPPLILAETASIFGELLLFEKFMSDARDDELKKNLLIQKLDDFYATIGRQSYFVMFEIEAHKIIAGGAGLEELNRAYLENLKEQFGSSLTIPDEFKYEWTSIPHIYHTPFYCYAYTFGNLLVLALYEKYKKEGESFVSKYLKILECGGSENPAKILKEVGIDIEDEKFWQGGFDLIKDMIEELKNLT